MTYRVSNGHVTKGDVRQYD